jgi:type VI secretion system secreted protein VgrG
MGAGGYISIDSVGVTIKGQLVKINAGGSAGDGSGASAEAPEDPREIEVEEPAPPAPPPEPPKELPRRRPVVEKTWITIRIVDADDEPLRGVAYQLRMPNGAIRRGTVDEDGQVTFHGIDPGECELTLPEIDEGYWEKV